MKARTSSRSTGWAKVSAPEAAEMRAEVLGEVVDLAERAAAHYRASSQPVAARAVATLGRRIQQMAGGAA